MVDSERLVRAEKLNVIERSTESLKPYPRNARDHTDHQIGQITASIRKFGFVNPILIDENGEIIAGHGRLEAAKRLGMSTVPTIQIRHLTDGEKRALRLADNKIADNAGWDAEALALELRDLIEIDIDVDVSITGFEAAEIDLAIQSISSAVGDSALDSVPVTDPDAPAVSRLDDLWELGEHRLLCGGATLPAAYEHLMGDDRAQMVFTDPPYNVPIDGHVSGLGRTQHREFVEASGEMSEGEFTDFLSTTFGCLAAYSNDGAVLFVFMDWRHCFEILTAARAAFDRQLNVCIWNKSNAGMGSLYRSKHEFVHVFKSGRKPHINNVELGRHGRNRTNVWDYPGVNTFRNDRMDELSMHPTVKPVQMIADAIMDCSNRGGIVLDSFVGSGSTIIAAESAGRRAFTMDKDPIYVDTAIRRWQALGGAPARLKATGQSFDDVLAKRAQEFCCDR